MGRRSSSRSSSSSEEGSLTDQSDSSTNERSPRKSKSRSSSSSKSKSRSRSSSPRESRSRQKHSDSSACLSRYYREHFGNHSPDLYMNLRISGFNRSLGKEEVIDILERELKKLAPFEIKVVPNPDGTDRLAYLNFKNDDCAKTVRRTMVKKLQQCLGPDIALDPSGVLRDQEGKFIPDRFNRFKMEQDDRAQQQQRRRYSPPSRHHDRRDHHHQHSNNNNYGNNKFQNLKRDDSQATRTLFVGNLPGDVRHGELMKVFAQYGSIEDIDIKFLNEGVAAYAFIVFVSIDSAMKAMKNQHGRSIRHGSNKCQIGYGRSQISTRLWIGGLGDWTTKEMLMKEFDRYGVIEQIEYNAGAQHSYIRFADVKSATDACKDMNNFSLHLGHRIQVDYAKEKKSDRKRQKSSSPEEEQQVSSKKRKPHTPSSSSSPSPDSNSDLIANYEQLNEQIACTWKGIVSLKKTDYPLRLHRIHGREHLLQDLLREEDGSAIKIKLDQRLPRDSSFYDKLLDMDQNQLAFMIGAEGSHSFTPLIEYLNDKKAIGMTKIGESALIHVLPHSSLTTKIMKKFAPKVQVFSSDSNFLLVILKALD